MHSNRRSGCKMDEGGLAWLGVMKSTDTGNSHTCDQFHIADFGLNTARRNPNFKQVCLLQQSQLEHSLVNPEKLLTSAKHGLVVPWLSAKDPSHMSGEAATMLPACIFGDFVSHAFIPYADLCDIHSAHLVIVSIRLVFAKLLVHTLR